MFVVEIVLVEVATVIPKQTPVVTEVNKFPVSSKEIVLVRPQALIKLTHLNLNLLILILLSSFFKIISCCHFILSNSIYPAPNIIDVS